jgi:hypothetical protein
MEGPLPRNDCHKPDLCRPLWPLAKLVGSSKTKKIKHLITSLTKPNTPKTYDSQNQKLVKPKASITKKLTKPSQKLIQSTSLKFHETEKKPHKSFWDDSMQAFGYGFIYNSLMLQHLSHSWALTHILTHTKKRTHGESKKCIKIVHLWILPQLFLFCITSNLSFSFDVIFCPKGESMAN